MKSTYFSGQGIVYLAKYNEDESIGEFIDLGNVPKLRILTDKETKTSKIELIIECLSKYNLELVFGAEAKKIDLPKLPSRMISTEHTTYFSSNEYQAIPDENTSRYIQFSYTNLPKGSYYLVLDGINTADCNSRFRVDIFKIKFNTLEQFFIWNEQLAQFELTGTIEPTNEQLGYVSFESLANERPEDCKKILPIENLPFENLISDDIEQLS